MIIGLVAVVRIKKGFKRLWLYQGTNNRSALAGKEGSL